MGIKWGEYANPMGLRYDPDIDLNREDTGTSEDRLSELLNESQGALACEIKEDGWRCQVHVDNEDIILYSKSGKRFDERCFPEIVKALTEMKLPRTILDAELRAEGNRYEGFAGVVARASQTSGKILSDKGIQKYERDRLNKCTLDIVLFDIMMHDRSYIHERDYENRRELLESIYVTGNDRIKITEQYVLTDPQAIIALYNSAEKRELEGIVLKDPQLPYLFGDDKHWVKIKKFEPLDLVIIGLYKNKDTKTYAQALVATFNHENHMYESIGSVNLNRTNRTTGMDFSEEVHSMLGKNLSKRKFHNVSYGHSAADVYAKPENSIVLEIGAMEINYGSNQYACGFEDGKGYSLRIGHVRSIREDKNSRQATTTEKVKELYEKKFSQPSHS